MHDEVVCRYFNVSGKTVRHRERKSEVVFYIGVVYRIHFAVYAGHTGIAHVKNLIDKMHSPVEHHSAAQLLYASPALGHAARAFDPRFDNVRLADKSGFDRTPHEYKILVYTAVLIYREYLPAFFCNSHHVDKLFGRHCRRLFAKYMLAVAQCILDYLRMTVVCSCNKGNVDVGVGKQGFA